MKFGEDYKQTVDNNGVPSNDLAIQGSSLRTPEAKDVDSVIFVSETQFDQYIIKRFSGRIKENGNGIDLTNKSHEDLISLGKKIQENPDNYNNQAETFANAVIQGSFNSKSDILPALKNIRKELAAKYPHLNIETVSIQYRGANFDIEPSMNIK